jgi:hypothetical protein
MYSIVSPGLLHGPIALFSPYLIQIGFFFLVQENTGMC